MRFLYVFLSTYFPSFSPAPDISSLIIYENALLPPPGGLYNIFLGFTSFFSSLIPNNFVRSGLTKDPAFIGYQ